jgi:hypothetical protein
MRKSLARYERLGQIPLSNIKSGWREKTSLIVISCFLVLTMQVQSVKAQTNNNNFIWGINGHPQNTEFWGYNNVETQLNYLEYAGCKYYRCSFVGGSVTNGIYADGGFAATLDLVVPQAAARGITVLPLLTTVIQTQYGTDLQQTNYQNHYQRGKDIAAYALQKGYVLPYWELGNEEVNQSTSSPVIIDYDGSSDAKIKNRYNSSGQSNYGRRQLAWSITGLYYGIHAAYNAAGKTPPKILITSGAWRTWGSLDMFKTELNGWLPGDIISWHWYSDCGSFTAPINDAQSASNGKSPYNVLKSYGKDIWITECGRQEAVNQSNQVVHYGGSMTSSGTEDTVKQATETVTVVNNLLQTGVKAVFFYNLYDETTTFASASYKNAIAYHGAIRKQNGAFKDVFYSFRNMIVKWGTLNPFWNKSEDYATYSLAPQSNSALVIEADTNNGTALAVRTKSTVYNVLQKQYFQIIPDGTDGYGSTYYKITPRYTTTYPTLVGKVLASNAWQNAPVTLVNDTGTSAPSLVNRRWYVSRIDDANGLPTGLYKINLMADYNYCLHTGTTTGAPLLVYPDQGWYSQRWALATWTP